MAFLNEDDKNVQSEPVAFPLVSRILREVRPENAFYFYKGIGWYLDIKAVSLAEFLEQIKTIDIVSLEFHTDRGDFANWFTTTLGDATLAREVYRCRKWRGEVLRNSLTKIVEARLFRLEGMT